MVHSHSQHASPEDTADLSPLAWVLDETRKSLQTVSKSLKRFAQEAEHARGVDLASVDASQLRLARQQLHQVGGALEMVGQTVAARMVNGMETAVQRFASQPETCTVQVAASLEQNGFALVEFVENQLSATPRPVLGLFPQYQQVLKLAGVDRIHPADLWPRRWRWAHPVLPAAAQALEYSAPVRKRLDHSVLRLMKHGDVHAADELATVSHGLAAGAGAERPMAFWVLAAGFFQAVSQALVPMDMYVKRAASRVLLQYTSLARGDTMVSERLALDLLFYCAQARPKESDAVPLLAAVRSAWGLAAHEPVDYTRPVFGLYDPAVLAQARRRIEAAKENWSALAGGDLTRLRTSVDQFGLVNQSLLKLHGDSQPLVDALAQVMAQLQQGGRAPVPELAIEVATAVLFLEASLAEFNPDDADFTARVHELADRLQRVLQGHSAPELAPWMEELYRRVSDRQTMGTVVSELRVTLAEVEQKLDQFFRLPEDKQVLEPVPALMGQMRGVLSVLGLNQAATAVARMRTQIEDMTEVEADVQSEIFSGRFEKLGNSLGALGFLLDTLSYQPVLARQLFHYDEQEQEFKYLSGRSGPRVGDEAAEDAGGGPLAESVPPMPGPTHEQFERMAAQAALDERPVLAQAARQAAQAARDEDQSSLDQALQVLQDMATPAASASIAASTRGAALESAVEVDEELLEIFLEEANEVVAGGHAALAVLAAAPSDVESLTSLRRAFHTLKGSSRMVGLSEFGEAAWALEQLLNVWLAENRPADNALRAIADQAMTAFEQWTADLAAQKGVPAAAWTAEPFQTLAEGLRVQGEHMTVDLLPQSPGVVLDVEPELEPESVADQPAAAEVDTAVAPVQAPLVEAMSASPATQSAAEDTGHALSGFDLSELDLPDLDLDGLELAEPVVLEDAGLESVSSGPDELSLTDVQQLAETLGRKRTADAPAALEVPELDLEPAPDQVLDLSEFDAALSSFAGLGEPLPQPTTQPVWDSLGLSLPGLESTQEVAQTPEPATQEQHVPQPVADAEGVELLDLALDFPDAVAAQDSDSDYELDSGEVDDSFVQVGELNISTALYSVYLGEADVWSDQLQAELEAWSHQVSEPVPARAIARAHSLAGSSGTVGFQPLSEFARAVEHALLRLQSQDHGTPEQAQVLCAAADEIRKVLRQFDAGQLQTPDTSILEAVQGLESGPALPRAPGSEDVLSDAAESGNAWPDKDEGPSFELPDDDVYLSELPVFDDEPEPVAPVAAPEVVDEPDAKSVLPLVQHLDEAIDAVDPDLFPIFEEEAEELLPQLAAALRRWQENPEAQLDARAEALRVLHTLKGSARLAGAMRLGEMAHQAESSIEALGIEGVNASDIAPVLEELDRIEHDFQRLRAQVSGQSWAPEDVSGFAPAEISEPAAVLTKAADRAAVETVAGPVDLSLVAARASARQTVRVQAQLLDRLLVEAGEVITSRVRLDADMLQLRSALNELGGNIERLRSQLRDIELQAETQMQSRMAQSKDEQLNFDPLEFDRFTRMQELSRMMAESVNDVATVQRNLQRAIESSEDALAAQARQSRELQRNLLRTRMVEFDGISERLYRVVRQASKESGKQVRLDILGGSIEVDRGILDRMTPAFEHLLRNSVVHGIEAPEVRRAAGKEAVGVITIDVQQSGNDVSVEFRDDGGGLNIERIRQRAIERGLLEDDEGLSEFEAGQMIFTPGFTTATDLTGLAGRGVGMDVVRTEVQALGGRIETQTRVGQGSGFKLVLPLTTAVTHVVMLRAGARVIGVPAHLIEVVLRASQGEVEQAYQAHRFSHGGEALPFFWAGALLQHSAGSTEPAGRTLPVVVLRSADQRIVLHVDEVLGNQEVVVKALGPQLSRMPGLVAITALASGAVALIYNPVALATVYGEQVQTEAGQRAPQHPEADTPASSDIPLVLVVDDSITVRRVTQRLLQREGYRVALAADGLQGLTRLREERPVVVLSDIEMPRMDGFDFLRNIRADAQFADLPVVMITSRIAEKHREHARQLGANHYLGKPYSEDELLALVQGYAQASVPV